MGWGSADSALVTSLIINVIISIIVLTLFVIFRRKIKSIYEPRCQASTYEGSDNPDAPLIPEPNPGLFGWVSSALSYPTSRLFLTHGLDAVIFVETLWACLILSTVQMIYGICILIPVNVTGSSDTFKSIIDSLTMMGLTAQSPRLTAHMFSVIINSLVAYYLMYRIYKRYLQYRLRLKADPSYENRTVLVRDIPSMTDVTALASTLDTYFGGDVETMVAVYRDKPIEKKWVAHVKAIYSLEKVNATLIRTGERVKVKVSDSVVPLLNRKEHDGVDFYTYESDKIKSEILERQSVLENDPRLDERPWQHTAFFTFKRNQSAVIAAAGVLSSTPNSWMPAPAPEPRDVNWAGFGVVGNTNRFLRNVGVTAFSVALAFFWAIPITFVAALTNINALGNISGLGWLKTIAEASPVVTGLISGFLPTLVVIIFLALVPLILRILVSFTGQYSKSDIDRHVFTKFFFFQLVNVFFVIILAGSLFASLNDIINKPTSIIDLLTTSVPPQATFYINYILLASLTGHTLALLRPVPLILRLVFHKWFSKSKRDWRSAEAPGRFSYETSLAVHVLIFLLGSVYSTMAPLITIFTTVYFAMALLSSKYNIIYVFIPQYEGKGNLWPALFGRMNVALLVYQLTLTGIFAARRFPAGTVISAFFFVLTFVFWFYTEDRFKRVAYYGSVEASSAIPSQVEVSDAATALMKTMATSDPDADLGSTMKTKTVSVASKTLVAVGGPVTSRYPYLMPFLYEPIIAELQDWDQWAVIDAPKKKKGDEVTPIDEEAPAPAPATPTKTVDGEAEADAEVAKDSVPPAKVVPAPTE